MENCSTVTTTLLKTNENNIPTPCEQEQSDINQTESYEPKHSHKGFPWYLLIIVFMATMLVMNAIEIRQYKQYSEAVEKQAYVLSVSINLLEETLLFNHHVLPEDIGFEELRSAWVSDPCYETSMPYYEALKAALEYFENNTESEPTFEPILV